MEAGIAAQDEEEVRAARRSLRVYGLRHGQCESNIYLESETLGLKGQVDLVIQTDDNPLNETELIPIDYKLSRTKPGLHFKLQLVAYGLLLQERYELPANRGFLYSIPKRRAIEDVFTPHLRTKLRQALVEMQDISQKEYMPTPTRQHAKCQVCEFRRFCNDVV
jgi:CRISPR-associated exonuclease Cas4